MGYGITYLTRNSASLLLLPSSVLLHLLSLKFQEIVSVKHSFTMQVYCENRFTFQIQLENEICTLTQICTINWKVTKFNMNINLNLIEQG